MTRTPLRRKSPCALRVSWLGRCALGISNRETTTAGRRDKRGSPVEPQAIGMAWVLACRPVGARAAPDAFANEFNSVFGTIRDFMSLELLL